MRGSRTILVVLPHETLLRFTWAAQGTAHEMPAGIFGYALKPLLAGGLTHYHGLHRHLLHGSSSDADIDTFAVDEILDEIEAFAAIHLAVILRIKIARLAHTLGTGLFQLR